MLTITIPETELYDEQKNTFITTKSQILQLEHSLVSVSKWESKWLRPFLSKNDKTTEESLDYIRCMTLTQNVDPEVYKRIPSISMGSIIDYIDDPMTATTFTNKPGQRSINREMITSEIIYFWMITFSIPFECQKWHLNRLLTLINVCNVKQQPAKKMSKTELAAKNRALNASRKSALNTTG
jgi:hypothetical protein